MVADVFVMTIALKPQTVQSYLFAYNTPQDMVKFPPTNTTTTTTITASTTSTISSNAAYIHKNNKGSE